MLHLYVPFRSTYFLFLHLYDVLVVVIKPELAKVTRTRGYTMWASQVPATNCSVSLYKKASITVVFRLCAIPLCQNGGWTHLDCQGVITPSSGPPINTSFLILRKFFFHSEFEMRNTGNIHKTGHSWGMIALVQNSDLTSFAFVINIIPNYWRLAFLPMEKLEPECANLLHLDWLFRCSEEPNNHCCSRTGLCDEGLWEEEEGGGRGEGFVRNLTADILRSKTVCFFLNSHHSSSCRWISSDLLQCNRGDRGWIWQNVGRGTSGSLCLQGKIRAGWNWWRNYVYNGFKCWLWVNTII